MTGMVQPSIHDSTRFVRSLPFRHFWPFKNTGNLSAIRRSWLRHVARHAINAWNGANNELISYVLQEDREVELAGLPDDSSLARIERYESHLSRQFCRALHELPRLQAARLGLRPSIPSAVDI